MLWGWVPVGPGFCSLQPSGTIVAWMPLIMTPPPVVLPGLRIASDPCVKVVEHWRGTGNLAPGTAPSLLEVVRPVLRLPRCSPGSCRGSGRCVKWECHWLVGARGSDGTGLCLQAEELAQGCPPSLASSHIPPVHNHFCFLI